MCDTIVAPPFTTRRGVMLFGKNSDRQRNEAQAVEYFPGAEHQPGTHVRCTYIAIPQVPRTHATLICRPFWIWGAEMGANDAGVVIGNEGVHSRGSAPEEPALTGMDLIRLALERAASAAEAVRTITQLLERHGQGGNGGHVTQAFYHNGFIIADANEAFVLETVGREWLVERVRGVRTISNIYSIGRDVDGISPGLPNLVAAAGWSTEAQPDYAAAIANPHREHIGNASARRTCTTALLRSCADQIEVADAMRVLRDHGSGDGFHPEWSDACTVKRTVCMHAGAADRSGQTVGSMISELQPQAAVHWVTATCAPCISIFKPVLMDAGFPAHGPSPTDRFDASTLWWRSEMFYRRAMIGGMADVLESIRAERDEMEARFRARVTSVLHTDDRRERSAVVAACWQEASDALDAWHTRLVSRPSSPTANDVPETWLEMSRLAGMSLTR